VKRKREETAIWGAVRSTVFIVTEGKTKFSSSEGFQLKSSPPSGKNRLERRQSLGSKGEKEMKMI
jgi:hypothetical protein